MLVRRHQLDWNTQQILNWKMFRRKKVIVEIMAQAQNQVHSNREIRVVNKIKLINRHSGHVQFKKKN